MKSGIYKITNVKNGKFYIGSAKDIDRRWWEHKNDLKKNKHKNPKLQHAWDFYGENSFEFIILENVIECELFVFCGALSTIKYLLVVVFPPEIVVGDK